MYRTLILQALDRLGLNTDPRLIEAWMRLEHPTLDHLDARAFQNEVKLASACAASATQQENEALVRSLMPERKAQP